MARSSAVIDYRGSFDFDVSPEVMWRSIEHADPLVAGVNCSLGADEIRPHIAELSRLTETYTACHPNAGLPNAFGGYDEGPEEMSEVLAEFAEAGMLNIVGGCCGIGPEHIALLRGDLAGDAAR